MTINLRKTIAILVFILFSLVECEAIAQDRACVSCHHWIYYADRVNLVSNCSGILDMLTKPLSEVTNRRLKRIMERVWNYNSINQHMTGSENKVCDALSRLCKSLSGYSSYYPSRSPRLLNLSNNLARRVKQLEYFDPLVQELAEELGLGISEYVKLHWLL